MPKLSHHRERQPTSQPKNLGATLWRVPILCIIASLFIAGLNTPLVQILIAQAVAMDPNRSEITPDVFHALQSKIISEKKIFAVRSIFRELTNKNASPQFERYRQFDPDNGLYSYLELLIPLRKSAATQPDQALLALVSQLRIAPMARLYQDHQRELAEKFLRDRGASPRVSAMESQRVSHRFGTFFEYHRPILRELADKLIQLGAQWRVAHHPRDALLAHRAVLKLFSDLLKDSPTPDVALLVAERFPSLMQELEADAKEAGMDVASDTEATARDVSRFVKNWHEQADEAGPSIIPWTGDVAVVPIVHGSMVRTFLAASLVASMWVVLLGEVLLLGIVVLINPRARDSHYLQPLSGYVWPASIAICAPVILLLVLRSERAPLAWIFTMKSVVPAMLLPLSVILLLGPSARIAIGIKPNTVDPRIPVRAITVMVLLFVATFILAWCLPVQTESWRPPIIIQRFRKLGVLLVAECLLFLFIWFIWGQVRRRRAGWPMGILAGSNFQIASRALLLLTLLSTAILSLNRAADSRHQTAFARAAADPITDRLGPNWRETYFDRGEILLQRLDSVK